LNTSRTHNTPWQHNTRNTIGLERITDENQVEEAFEAQAQEALAQEGAQAQPISSTSFLPQRITRSMAKALGDEHHLMTLLVITLV